MTMEYDVFISHASEDKQDVALPLASHLQARGLRVWIDESELTLGDSLRRKIDHGLSQSKFGVVILSPAFFSKEWPNKELDALVAREDGRDKVILPVWHNIGAGELVNYSPLLADKLSVSTQNGIEFTAEKIINAVSNSGDSPGLSKEHIGPTEEEVLQRLGHQMLLADSSWELRKVLYELEQYMARYPHSPDARILKDRIVAGMQRAERMETPTAAAPPKDRGAPATLARSPSLVWRIIVWLLVVAGTGAVFLYWLR
ncbi:MAG: toll/interleukin-1 receptor domain-containing protein [Candidatus Thiodiazotropha sp.]